MGAVRNRHVETTYKCSTSDVECKNERLKHTRHNTASGPDGIQRKQNRVGQERNPEDFVQYYTGKQDPTKGVEY